MTGLSVETEQGTTVVEVRTHSANLTTGDPATEIAHRLKIRFDGVMFAPGDGRVEPRSQEPMIVWTARWTGAPRRVVVDSPLFPDHPEDRTIVTVVNVSQIVGTAVLAARDGPRAFGNTTFELTLRFVREGILHIFTGADHIAFLLALLMPVARIRDVAKIVTAFTLAHSITLSLAALGVVHLSSRIIEPAIAVSIIAAAAENIQNRRNPVVVRTAFAFGFGLIHGFGFAGALAELGLPRSSLALSLFTFNAGVEIGQLILVSLFMPLLSLAGTLRAGWRGNIVRYGSFAIIIAGLFWTVQRITTI